MNCPEKYRQNIVGGRSARSAWRTVPKTIMKPILLVFLLACTELWAQPSAQSPAPAANAAPPEDMIPAGTIAMRGMDLEDVLTIYGQFVNRTILRPASLPAQKIFLTTQTPLTRKEIIQALDDVLSLNGISVVNFGDKFVKVVPNTSVGQEAAPFSTNDVSKLPDFGPYVTHVIQLKYVRPSEMQFAITPFAKMPGGILAIDASQILILRDNTENVKRMLEMIKLVDVDVPSEIFSEVIPIKYAKATDIASALSSLSSGGGGVTSIGGNRGGPTTRGGPTGGINMPGGIGGYGGQNPIGGTQPIGAPGMPGGIQNPANQSLQGRLQSIINRAASAGDFQILGPTKIIPDERMNSLLVFASRQDMVMITNIISKLDVILAQVLIETIIMEVSLDDSKNFGVSAAQRPKSFGNNISGVGGYNNGQNFFGSGGTNSFPGNLVSSLGSGFNYWAKLGSDFDVAVQAAAVDSRINVLSRPRIQTSHAVPGHIFIGQTVPFITSSYVGAFGGTGSSSSYQNQQVGITLDVTPYINPDGLVVMDIAQTVSQLGNSVQIDGNPVPTTTERDANATVAVKNHDTIMLGGFISTTKSKSKSGVPLLMNIPILGALFSSVNDTSQRVELIVLIRPTVLPTPESAATAAVAEQDQMPGVRQGQKEIQEEDDKRLKQAAKKLDSTKAGATQRDAQGFPVSP